MKERQIEHRGIVKSVLPGIVCIARAQDVACAACAAAQLCHSSEKQEKVIEVATNDASRYAVGKEVTIVGSLGLGLRAALWAYVLPLVLMMVVLCLMASWFGTGVAAISALASLVLYYIILYMLRNKLQQRFQFHILA